MAGGELAAVFKGLAEDAAQAARNTVKSTAEFAEKAAEKEEANLARMLDTEAQITGDFAAFNLGVTVTVKRPGGAPVSEWAKKAKALVEASDRGGLAKTAPVRAPAVTAAYRQNLIKRVWNQFATQNRPFADSMIQKLTDGTIHMDHKIDLQLGGRDAASNVGPLLGRVNTSVGSQIGNQLRGIPFGTPIYIEIEP